jgi:ATP-binding cassette subfamily B protein
VSRARLPALNGLSWPADQAAVALCALACAAGMASPGQEAALPGSPATPAASLRDLQDAAERLGLDLDAVEISPGALRRALAQAAPALLRLPGAGGGYLALASGRRRLRVAAPDGSCRSLAPARLARVLLQPAEQLHGAAVAELLAALPLAERRRRRARRALLAAHLAEAPGVEVLLLGSSAARPLPAQLLAARLPSRAGALAAAQAALEALSLAGWVLLGRGLLAGRIEPAWLYLWALLLLAMPLLRALEIAAAADLAERLGTLLRRRLLATLPTLGPGAVGAIGGEGTGRLLGRLLAAEEVERVLLAGGPAALLAIAELAGAAVALARGAAPAAHLAGLAGALLTAGLLLGCCHRCHRARAEHRLAVTGRLVEAMAGHRTRLVCGAPAGIAQEDSGDLAALHALGRRRDAWEAALRAGLPRLWQLYGLAALAPSAGAGTADPVHLAAALGGILLGHAALTHLGKTCCEAAAAVAAAGQLRPLSPPATGRRAAAAAPRPGAETSLVLEARDLEYCPRGRPRPLLAGARLALRDGDRVLLEGASGAGKSTLAALLCGERQPDSGLLLLGGLDLPTLGARQWRRRVASVPQLHANHLFADTLAFNLLLGRAWPPAPRDLEEAADLCRDLGLGPLLDRLPAGLEQRIGEAGWRLSDGEASRVCLARALLQEPDLLILDESLGALDPETRLRVLGVVARRAPTLLLIAHADPGWPVPPAARP